MPLVFHAYRHLESFKSSHKPLLILAIMLVFWEFFDSIMSFIVPLKIVEDGFSKTEMGVIIASSSVIGAIFDFILSRFTKNTTFHKLYFYMFLFCISFPLLMAIGSSIFIYIAAMAAWGFYYDLLVFGNYNFVKSETGSNEHAKSFGLLDAFRAIGFIAAPVIAGLFVFENRIDPQIFVMALIFLGLASCMYLLLSHVTRNTSGAQIVHPHRHFPKMNEFYRWIRVSKKIYPLIIIGVLLYTVEAFFWTLGPLLSESLSQIHPFGGILLSMYFLPTILTGFMIGTIISRFGKKRLAYGSLFMGSVVLLFLGFIHGPLLIIATVFISSTLTSLVYPSFKGLIADYISKEFEYESEIEGLADISGNLGYVIGPFAAGILADILGIQQAFFALGFIIICVLLGLLVTKQKFFQEVA